MKVALCCIGRLENQYAVEFVEWYKNLGFTKIFIYDNNHDCEEYFEDVIQSYIDNGLVDVIPYRNKDSAQRSAYVDCYRKHKHEFDWMAFFDFDEFLVLKNSKNIGEFVERFNDFDCIKINWMTYDDNDLVMNDGRRVNERFTRPIEYDACVSYGFPENNHTKSIVRCNIDNFIWTNPPHVPNCVKKCCNADGERVDNSPFQKYTFNNAYIKHFSMKTIDEYFNGKRIRGQGGRSYKSFKSNYKIENFFKINKKTDEKLKYIESLTNEIHNT